MNLSIGLQTEENVAPEELPEAGRLVLIKLDQPGLA